MITNSQQAFEYIEQFEEGIPYEGITYLYDASPSDEIREEVLELLREGFEGQYADEELLAYAIVAEKYTEKKLIEPVLEIFRHPEYDNDMLYEQGAYLLSLLMQEFPDQTMEKVMPLLNKFDEHTSHYIYLFELFCYADLKKNESRLLKVYKKAGDLYAGSIDEVIYYRIRKGGLPEGMEKWLLKLCGKSLAELEKAHADFVPVLEKRKGKSWLEFYKKREEWFNKMSLNGLTINEAFLQDFLEEAGESEDEPEED